MEFYREVVGGESESATVADFGSPEAFNGDKVLHTDARASST